MTKPWEKYSSKKESAPWEKYKKEPRSEESFGDKALDLGLRALDWTAGMGRVSAAGLTDLATLGQANLTRPGDFTRMIQGQAPTTEEFLGRSGMEEGPLRTGLGFAGDVALDPGMYASGGTKLATKLPKLAKILTAADKAVELPLKGIGAAYKGATRKAAPRIASSISGADTDALKEYIKDPETVKKIAENVFENTDTAVSQAKSNVLAKKSEIAGKMNEHLRNSDKMINISQIKSDLSNKIADLQNMPRRSPQQQDLLEQLLDLKQNAFSDIVGDSIEEIPDMIDANRMFDLKESLRRSKGASTIFDPKTNQMKQVDSRFKTISKDLYGKVNQEVDKTFENASELREAFKEVGDDFSFLDKRFKQDVVRPESDTNALLRLSKNKETKKKLQKLDEVYGSNLSQAGSQARGAFQLADPSLIPVSGQGVVSTGRIAASSALGAQFLGDTIGTRGGAAAGLIGGMLAASPAVMSRAGRAAYKGEQLFTPILKKTPTSVYKRGVINKWSED